MGSHDQTGLEMSVDLFSMPVGQGARFWSDYMSALKGVQDLHVPEDDHVKTYYPSIMETIPSTHPEIRREFGKLESLILSQPRGKTRLTPVIGGATDRISYLYGIVSCYQNIGAVELIIFMFDRA